MKSLRYIPLIMLMAGCATSRIPSGDRYAMYMDGVDARMATPDYWLKASTKPDRIIMTEQEIATWYGIPEKEFDKVASDGKVDTAYIDNWLAVFGQRRSLFDQKGNAIDPVHWDKAIANMDIGKLTSDIRYGLTVKNTEERVLPTSERGYQDRDNALFDDLIMTRLLVNEQVIVLHTSLDSMWYLVLGKYAPAGWVPKDDIAICEDRKSWNRTQSDDFLLVTADRLRLDVTDPDEDCYTELTMGTKLKLVSPDSVKADSDQRFGKNVYAVSFPVRNGDGTLGYRQVFLPAREGVHVGYLPYTSRNILKQAFSCLGDRYGWGGTFGARDCSSYCQDIYRCFGILLPRNSSMQARYPGHTVDLEGMTDEQKYKTLKREAIPGALLFMPGHVYMYLGQKNGRIYTINSASSVMIEGKKRYIQSVTVNTLDEIRPSGKTWMESTITLKIYEKDY